VDPVGGTEFLFKTLDFGYCVFVAGAAESQGERPEGQLEEPAPFFARDVIVSISVKT
jgi:hypothetical protein